MNSHISATFHGHLSDAHQSDVSRVPLLQESCVNAIYVLAATRAALEGKKAVLRLAMTLFFSTLKGTALDEACHSRSTPKTRRVCGE